MPTIVMDVDEVARLTAENVRLNARVDELLESNTRLLEDRRAAEARAQKYAGTIDRIYRRAMVRDFHRLGDHPILDVPQVPPLDRLKFRIDFIAEEFVEMLAAVLEDDVSRSGPIRTRLKLLTRVLGELIGSIKREDIDLPAVVDAWADLVYVIDGAALEFGVDLDAVFRGVHEANLQKFGPGSWKREGDNKQMKPPDWKPFDVDAELRRQGWKP